MTSKSTIDHKAPKDLGWAELAIQKIDTRLDALEQNEGAPPPEMQDVGKTLSSLMDEIGALRDRVAALESKPASVLSAPPAENAAD